MTNETKNFEINIKTKQINYLTNDQLKENEKKRIKKIKEAKFVQHIPLFKKLKITNDKYDQISNIFHSYYEYAMDAFKNKKICKSYLKLLDIDFNKFPEYKQSIDADIEQIVQKDAKRMGANHFGYIPSKTQPGKHPSHPASLLLTYYLSIYHKNKKYVKKYSKERSTKNQFYTTMGLYGQGSDLLPFLICLLDLEPVDSFVLFYLLDEKTSMYKLNTKYQDFSNFNFFSITFFVLIKLINKDYWAPLFIKKEQEDFNQIMNEAIKAIFAGATLTPGLYRFPLIKLNYKITPVFINSIEDMCFHLLDKGPSFILCLLSATMSNIKFKVDPNQPLELMELLTVTTDINNTKVPKLPVEKAFKIYKKIKKSKFKSVDKLLCKIGKIYKKKQYLYSAEPMPEATILKKFVGFDSNDIKRLFRPIDKKYLMVDFVKLNEKFIINNNDIIFKKGGRKKRHKNTRRKSRNYDGEWELLKKKSKRKTLKKP
tara:strand:+ start:3299 stop:4750 length:1452 start_codon:yes stop_codon:yes gene_type:complete